MSGHSKWSNIKNRKGAQDKKRSETFTRASKNILTAIRLGGGSANPEVNGQLKVAIDKAREVNMPKENIERLLARFEERKNNLVSMVLEGYAPFGVPIIVEAETDNKNRTLGEIKLIFRDNNATLGESNSVAFQFKRVGEIELETQVDESVQLELIDIGAIDFEDNLVLTEATSLNAISNKLKDLGIEIVRSEIIYKPNSPMSLNNDDEIEKIFDFVDELESHDDVIGVYVGADL